MTGAHPNTARHSETQPRHPFAASLSARWRSFQRFSLSNRIRIAAGLATVLFAIVCGVYALIFFNHRETATCDVVSVGGEHFASRGIGEIWDVTTSCGVYSINSGTWVLNDRAASELANSLQTSPGHNTYRLDFQGWGTGRIIIGATFVN
jgi:hypothetical protein